MVAVFIDRDGTMGGTGGGIHPFEFQMYESTPASIKLLNDSRIKVFLFTNQNRVGRGYFTENELLQGFQIMARSLLKQGAYLNGIYYCPHKPGNCQCHKPSPGMLLRAQKEHGLHLNQCYVVGDTENDIIVAEQVGAKKILVMTGRWKRTITKRRNAWNHIKLDYIAKDILDAAQWIIHDFRRSRSKHTSL